VDICSADVAEIRKFVDQQGTAGRAVSLPDNRRHRRSRGGLLNRWRQELLQGRTAFIAEN
jgi:hypothetical protein